MIADHPAGAVLQRQQMRSELDEMANHLQQVALSPGRTPVDVAEAVVRRRTRHIISAALQVLDEHPLAASGRCTACTRRQTCPAGELLRSYVTGWLATGGLAERQEGDPARVSTRRLH